MKKVLLFNMPEDKFDFEMANKGYNFSRTLDDLEEALRRHVKYGSTEIQDSFEEKPETVEAAIYTTVVAIRSLVFKLRQENDAFANE